ncbi:hypothetical protein HK101_002808 [Irineochytrium annulatum]|nr:hypothetical protein HK101_002808 [Irineochytrium annulatum]
MMPPPGLPLQRPPGQVAGVTRPADDDDAGGDTKRQRRSAEELEAALIPEQNPISLKIQVSKSSVATLTNLPPSMSVQALKDKISQEVEGVAVANKLKLSLGRNGLTMKNGVSLAYYNLVAGETVVVSGKERGGKK